MSHYQPVAKRSSITAVAIKRQSTFLMLPNDSVVNTSHSNVFPATGASQMSAPVPQSVFKSAMKWLFCVWGRKCACSYPPLQFPVPFSWHWSSPSICHSMVILHPPPHFLSHRKEHVLLCSNAVILEKYKKNQWGKYRDIPRKLVMASTHALKTEISFKNGGKFFIWKHS